MSIKPEDLFRRGSCQLIIGNDKKKEVNCFLNFESRRLECYWESNDFFGGIGDVLGNSYEINDLKLTTPNGIIFASEILVAFATSMGGGTHSVAQTEVTHKLGIDSRLSRLEFVVNEKIKFSVDSEGFERMFFPGFDIAGRIDLDKDQFFIGAKDYLSLIGECNSDLRDILVAMGIAIGAPLSQFAYHHNKTLDLYLNNFGLRLKSRPIIFTENKFRNMEEARTNLRDAYKSAHNYIETLEPEKRAGMRNAVLSYLEGRILSNSYEIKLLAAFHFLEWFDGTTTQWTCPALVPPQVLI